MNTSRHDGDEGDRGNRIPGVRRKERAMARAIARAVLIATTRSRGERYDARDPAKDKSYQGDVENGRVRYQVGWE